MARMRVNVPVYMLLATLMALSACNPKLKALEAASPSADDYDSALAAEYQAYADSEAEQKRRVSSEYFAGKGLKALAHARVEPELINERLPDGVKASLQDSRQILVGLLTDSVKHVAAQKAARTQLLFDCWQNQEVQNIPSDMAFCKDEFAASLAELQEVFDFFDHNHEVTKHIFFLGKSTVLNEEAKHTIDQIAKHVEPLSAYTITIDGHKGRGLIKAKRNLAPERVRAAQVALEAAGVPTERIILQESGQEVVFSSDEDANANRQRVDVTIRTAAASAPQKAPPHE